MLAFRTLVTTLLVITISFSVSIKAVDLSKMVTPKNLSANNVDQIAVVRGKIENIKEPFGEAEPLLFHVGNSSDGKKVLVGYTQDKYQTFHADKGIPQKGTQMIAQGKVWDYQGMLLIVPKNLSDIMIEGYDHTLVESTKTVSQSKSEPETKIAEGEKLQITMNDYDNFRSILGQEVTFKGTISDYTPSWSERAPNIMKFEQDGKEFEVVFWENENSIDDKLKKANVTVEASGQLQDYRGRLQVKVSDLKTIKEVTDQKKLAAQ